MTSTEDFEGLISAFFDSPQDLNAAYRWWSIVLCSFLSHHITSLMLLLQSQLLCYTILMVFWCYTNVMLCASVSVFAYCWSLLLRIGMSHNSFVITTWRKKLPWELQYDVQYNQERTVRTVHSGFSISIVPESCTVLYSTVMNVI